MQWAALTVNSWTFQAEKRAKERDDLGLGQIMKMSFKKKPTSATSTSATAAAETSEQKSDESPSTQNSSSGSGSSQSPEAKPSSLTFGKWPSVNFSLLFFRVAPIGRLKRRLLVSYSPAIKLFYVVGEAVRVPYVGPELKPLIVNCGC